MEIRVGFIWGFKHPSIDQDIGSTGIKYYVKDRAYFTNRFILARFHLAIL